MTRHGRGSRRGRNTRSGYGNSNGRGGFRNKDSGDGKYKRFRYAKPRPYKNSWYNSSVPAGGDDDILRGYDDARYGGDIYISPRDIENYYFGRNVKKSSLRMAGMRRLWKDNSDISVESFDFDSYRKRPVVFVKAAEVYDPSHDLIMELRKRNPVIVNRLEETPNEREDEKEPHSSERENYGYSSERGDVDVNFENDNEASSEKLTPEMSSELVTEQGDNYLPQVEPEPISESESESEPEEESPTEDLSERKNEDLFFVDSSGDRNSNLMDEVPTVDIHADAIPGASQYPNLEFNPTLTIGGIQMTTNRNARYGNGNTSRVYGSRTPKSFSKENDENVARLHLYKGEIETDMTSSNRSTSSDGLAERIEDLNITRTPDNTNSQDNDSTGDKEDTPPFGFLDEDYVVNTNEVEVFSIRFGAHENSYLVKSHRLFGSSDSQWVDQQVLTDFLVNDLHLPEHRLVAYFQFVKDSLFPKEKEQEEAAEPNYSDVPFSDTDAESEESTRSEASDNESLTEDMREGLDDLISYTLRYDGERNMEYETKSLDTVGKGRKKQLLIDESLALDSEMKQLLQDKFATRRDAKIKKRRTKEDFISEENKNSSDLLKKYQYGLHVQNIKDEFELFLSSNREVLIFPPLDPHGNKTIKKFANHYNMKSANAGAGKQSHVVVIKTKKTRAYMPNYNLINQLTRQRPIFMRIDVKQDTEKRVGNTETHRVRAKFHVKEGEIVGESASEIGRENIGRRLLEKLGWTQGESLGAHGNKGISEPLMARVKKSKTGLGHPDHKHRGGYR